MEAGNRISIEYENQKYNSLTIIHTNVPVSVRSDILFLIKLMSFFILYFKMLLTNFKFCIKYSFFLQYIYF